MSAPDASRAKADALNLLDALRQYQGSEQMKLLVRMLDEIEANYAARLIDCQDNEITKLRHSGQQIQLLRTALVTADPSRISLLV